MDSAWRKHEQATPVVVMLLRRHAPSTYALLASQKHSRHCAAAHALVSLTYFMRRWPSASSPPPGAGTAVRQVVALHSEMLRIGTTLCAALNASSASHRSARKNLTMRGSMSWLNVSRLCSGVKTAAGARALLQGATHDDPHRQTSGARTAAVGARQVVDADVEALEAQVDLVHACGRPCEKQRSKTRAAAPSRTHHHGQLCCVEEGPVQLVERRSVADIQALRARESARGAGASCERRTSSPACLSFSCAHVSLVGSSGHGAGPYTSGTGSSTRRAGAPPLPPETSGVAEELSPNRNNTAAVAKRRRRARQRSLTAAMRLQSARVAQRPRSGCARVASQVTHRSAPARGSCTARAREDPVRCRGAAAWCRRADLRRAARQCWCGARPRAW